jgi:hypothetical protein
MDHFEYVPTILGENELNHITLTTMHMSLEGKRIVEIFSKYPMANLVPISNDQKSHLRKDLVKGYEVYIL